MAKCKYQISEGVGCPNVEWRSGYCALHSDIDWNERNTDKVVGLIGNNLDTILLLNFKQLIIKDIDFPSKFSFKLENEINSALEFRKCRFTGALDIGKLRTKLPMLFHECDFLNVEILNLGSSSTLTLSKCNITSVFEIGNIASAEFALRIENTYAKTLVIKNVSFNKEFEIINNDSSKAFGTVEIEKVSLNKPSAIQTFCSQSWINISEVEFNSLTILDLRISNNVVARINLKQCGIDGLYLKNLKECLDSNGRQINILKPYLKSHLTKSFNTFKDIKKGDSLNDFLSFVRLMKDEYRESEKREIYDYYYVLDQYYSRFQKNYGKLNQFINRCSYEFSLYGYSIWRPFLWLICVLFIFNTAYYLYELPKLAGASFSNYFCSYWTTFASHLEKISFFRTPTGLLEHSQGKRIIFIFECLILIPIVTSIILGIRKLFKRV